MSHRQSHRLRAIAFTLPVLTCLAGCGGDPNGPCIPGGEESVAVVRISLVPDHPDPFPIASGNSLHLYAVATGRDACGEIASQSGSNERATWIAGDPTIARTYPNGVVHTLAPGETEIRETSGSATLRLRSVAQPAVGPLTTLVGSGSAVCGVDADGTLQCWGSVPSLCLRAGAGFACGADYVDGPLSDGPPLEANLPFATCAAGPPSLWEHSFHIVSDFLCSRVPSRHVFGTAFAVADLSSEGWCVVTAPGALICQEGFAPPRQLAPSTAFVSVALGGPACALDGNGVAYCWDRSFNSNGQLGDSTRTPHEQPQPVRGTVQFTQIDVFSSHSCGLATDGRAWCWGGALFHAGGPNYPELCRADAFNTGSPCSLIPRLHSDSVFDAITVGGSGGLEGHVCGLSPDGSAYCWGGNFDGQLGDGTTSSTSEPVPVGGGLRFASLSAGNSHTCGITVGGITYCWGSNSNGQLGAPAVTGALTPVPVSGGTTYVQVLAGSFHTCGRTLGGIVECWGWNEGGQLGNGTIGDRSVPTRISGQ